MSDLCQRAARELAERSWLLEAFFANTLTSIVLLDRNFNFIRVNEAYNRACARAELLPAIRRVADPRASQSPRDRPESAGPLPVHRGVDQTGGEHK